MPLRGSASFCTYISLVSGMSCNLLRQGWCPSLNCQPLCVPIKKDQTCLCVARVTYSRRRHEKARASARLRRPLVLSNRRKLSHYQGYCVHKQDFGGCSIFVVAPHIVGKRFPS
uniref:Uncharacterized protein n=1 Tax=Ixodes ricinus TaxID=34613 RepID=A0A147BR89_IXORI